jgi:hypothetical protein
MIGMIGYWKSVWSRNSYTTALGGDVVVRRVGLEELPVGRLVGITELGHPGGAGQQQRCRVVISSRPAAVPTMR